ncbi:hypothetical protein KAS08_00880 [Candidatus Pacearchaeota archaeon]|nr:hypothetical protein [Candidatus Pacearchaeota archaeon]
MDTKKGTVILVSIALILAITAIALNLTSSEPVSTTPKELQTNAGAGEVGIVINTPEGIEDKGAEGDLA